MPISDDQAPAWLSALPRYDQSAFDLIKSAQEAGEAIQKRLEAHQAGGMFEHLATQWEDFQSSLKEDEEIGACLASFGQVVVIRVEAIGYHNPHMMVIYGVDDSDGQQVRLVQHLHQLSLLLKVLKVKPGQQARRIGFGSGDEPDSP